MIEIPSVFFIKLGCLLRVESKIFDSCLVTLLFSSIFI